MPSETKQDIAKSAPLNGAQVGHGPTVLCEFRAQQPDVIKWVDKQTGVKREMQKLNVSAEFSATGQQVMLEVMPARGETVVQPLPYKKGDLVLFTLSNYASGRDGCRGRVVSHSGASV